MRRTLTASLLLLGSVVLTGCSHQAPVAIAPVVPSASNTIASSSTTPMPSTSFSREQMIALYTKVRASIDEATPATYFTLVEEMTNDPAKVALFTSHWPETETKNALKEFLFSDLSTHEYIDVRQEGEWAAYYHLSDLEEKDRLNVSITRFHLKNGVWMVYPKSGAYSVEAPATPAERTKAIEDAIKESDSLQIKPKS